MNSFSLGRDFILTVQNLDLVPGGSAERLASRRAKRSEGFAQRLKQLAVLGMTTSFKPKLLLVAIAASAVQLIASAQGVTVDFPVSSFDSAPTSFEALSRAPGEQASAAAEGSFEYIASGRGLPGSL